MAPAAVLAKDREYMEEADRMEMSFLLSSFDSIDWLGCTGAARADWFLEVVGRWA